MINSQATILSNGSKIVGSDNPNEMMQILPRTPGGQSSDEKILTVTTSELAQVYKRRRDVKRPSRFENSKIIIRDDD